MLLTILIACTVNSSNPATPGSPAAEALASVSRIQEQAAKIEELSNHLEGLTDVARAAEEGPERDAIIAQMREAMDEITQKNTALQAEVTALEATLHEAAGDPLLTTAEEDAE